MLKLAGLLKEGVEEWPKSALEEADEQTDSDGEEAVRKLVDDMNARAKEELGSGTEGFVLLLSADALIDSGINTPEKLQDYFDSEEARERYKESLQGSYDEDEKEWYKNSLQSHGGLDDEEKSESSEPDAEPEASAEEMELEKLPLRRGMGRSLEETYIDNMKEEIEEAPPPHEPEARKAAGMSPLPGNDDDKGLFGEPLKSGPKIPAAAMVAQAKTGSPSLEETIRRLVHEVLLEKAQTYKGKSMRLGGGGRFAKFVDSLKKSGKSEEQAKAIAYKAGVKKYGKGKMSKMAATGKKRAAKKED